MAIGDYLTTTEVARTLHVSAGRVRQFVVEGRLLGKKIGTGLFFHRSDVAKFAKQPRKSGFSGHKKNSSSAS